MCKVEANMIEIDINKLTGDTITFIANDLGCPFERPELELGFIELINNGVDEETLKKESEKANKRSGEKYYQYMANTVKWLEENYGLEN